MCCMYILNVMSCYTCRRITKRIKRCPDEAPSDEMDRRSFTLLSGLGFQKADRTMHFLCSHDRPFPTLEGGIVEQIHFVRLFRR